MFNVEKVLPFLEKAPILKRSYGNVVAENLVVLSKWKESPKLNDYSRIEFPRGLEAILVKPLNLMVLDAPIATILKVYNYCLENKEGYPPSLER